MNVYVLIEENFEEAGIDQDLVASRSIHSIYLNRTDAEKALVEQQNLFYTPSYWIEEHTVSESFIPFTPYKKA